MLNNSFFGTLFQKRTLFNFLKVFIVFQLVSILVIFLLMGWYDGSMSYGLPLGFYKISCGMSYRQIIDKFPCDYGFKTFKFIADLVIIYIIVLLVVKRPAK